MKFGVIKMSLLSQLYVWKNNLTRYLVNIHKCQYKMRKCSFWRFFRYKKYLQLMHKVISKIRCNWCMPLFALLHGLGRNCIQIGLASLNGTRICWSTVIRLKTQKPEENSCKNYETSSLSQTLFCVLTCWKLLNGF